MRRIVRVNELARPRQMQIVEAREPEAQRRGTKQRGPLRALVGGKLAHALVRAGQRIDELGNERAGVGTVVDDAPVVDGYREIVCKEVGRREAEVDDARDAITLEQHVVAKEIAMDRAARRPDLAESRQELELGGEQL